MTDHSEPKPEIDWEDYDISTGPLPAQEEKVLPEAPEGYELIGVEELRILRSDQRRHEVEKEVLNLIFDEIKKQEKKLDYWQHYGDAQSPDRVKSLLRYMERGSQAQYHNVIAFRDQALIQFNALQIVVQMCLMGGTHHEKNARLRGLADVLSVAVEKMTQVSDRYFTQMNWRWNLLESDSSLPTLQRANWHLEEKLKAYQAKFGVLKEETDERDDDTLAQAF